MGESGEDLPLALAPCPTLFVLFVLGAWLEHTTGFLDVVLEIVMVSILLLAVKTGLTAGLAVLLLIILLLARSQVRASGIKRR